MKIRNMFVAVFTATTISMYADTILWYRLDGFAPGVKTTASTLIDNLANPGNNQSVCHSFTTSRGTDANWMPYGTNGIGSSVSIYDPATGIFHPRQPNALHFGLTEVTSDLKDGYGGFLRLNPSGLAPTNITVEAVFRLSPGDYTSWSFAPIAMQEGTSASNERWVLTAAGYQNKLAARFMCCDADGSNAVQHYVTGVAVTPGRWHHAAFTFDSNGAVVLYLDYVRVGGSTWAGKQLATSADKALTIGANNGTQKRTFPGDILEVRVSDVALAPANFLRVRETPRLASDDTLLHVPVTMASPALAGGCVDMNVVTNASARAAVLKAEADAPDCSLDAARTSDIVREGIGSTTVLPNVGSLLSPTNGAGKGTAICVTDTNALLFADSCTVEFFFRTPGEIHTAQDASWTLFMSPAVRIGIGHSDGRAFAYTTAADGTDAGLSAVGRVDDGNWHHIAYVYDADLGRNSLYVDYALKGTSWKIPKSGLDGQDVAWFGRRLNAPLQYFPGWLDEMRITRRALRPYEFLTDRPVPAVPPRERLLAYAAFDGDYSVEPYPLLSPDGTGVAREGGNVPTFNALTPGTIILLDGEGGTCRRRNAGSLRMDGSQVRFGRLAQAERSSFTVECFAKVTAAELGVGFLRQNRTADSFEGSNPDARWMLYLAPGNAARMWAAIRTTVDGRTDVLFSDFSTPFADGKWHHYAVTFAVNVSAGATNTVMELWRDYVSYGARTANGVLVLPSNAECAFTIGANNNFTGWVDELRISEGVLPVSAFMRRLPRGNVVSFR